jgi:hypothetical protein
MKHIHTFESFLNEGTVGMEKILDSIKDFDANIKFNKKGRTIEFPGMGMNQLDALCKHLYNIIPAEAIEQKTTGNHLSIKVSPGY